MFGLIRFFVIMTLSVFLMAPSPGVLRRYNFNETGSAWITRLGTPTFWIDFSQDPSGSTITTNSEHVLTKIGAPERHSDHTLPSGLGGSSGYGHWFDGVNDYWTRTDDGTFEPEGDASWHMVFIPHTDSGYDDLWTKWENSTNQEWIMSIDNTNGDVFFTISSDGSNTTGVTSSNMKLNEPTIITVAYDYVTDGTSIVRLWVNNATVAESTTAVGPIYPGSVDMYFCGRDIVGGGNECGVTMQVAAYWDGQIATEADHKALMRKWQGLYDWSVDSDEPPAVIATPPGSEIEPFLVEQPIDTASVGSPATGKGGLCNAGPVSNYVQRASMETCTGTPSTPTGWSVVRNDGTGAVTGTCETDHKAHKAQAFKAVKTSPGDGFVTVRATACIDINPSNDYYVDAWFYGSSDDEDLSFGLRRYSDNACSTYVDTVYGFSNQNIGEQWTNLGYKADSSSWGSTESVEFQAILVNSTGDGTCYVDACQVRQSSHPISGGCYADTAATATCNAIDATLDAPFMPIGQWQIEFTAQTPFAWDDTSNHYFFEIPKTGGTNNNRIQAYFNADVAYLNVYTSDSTLKTAQVDCNIAANTDAEMTFRKHAGGWIQVCCDNTCGSYVSDVVNDDIGSDIIIDGTSGGDIWIRNLVIRRRIRGPS